MFRQWLEGKRDDYESWGNGSAMRISPIGFYAKTVEELEQLVIDSCKCTHNSKEAILGATVIAQAIFLAKRGYSKQDIMNMFHQRMPEWKILILIIILSILKTKETLLILDGI